MQSSFCERLHEVWWAWLDGEEEPFIRVTEGYNLYTDNGDSSAEPVARALRYCYRRHRDVCDSNRFTPRRDSCQSVSTYHDQEER